MDLALSEHRQPAGQGSTDRDPLVVTIERQETLFSHGIGRASAAVYIDDQTGAHTNVCAAVLETSDAVIVGVRHDSTPEIVNKI